MGFEQTLAMNIERNTYMPQNFNRLPLLILTIAALLIAGPAFARAPFHGGGGHDQDRFLKKHGDKLGLDEEAKAAIQSAIDGARPRSEELRKQRRAAHKRMRELLDQDMPEEKAVMTLADEIGTIETAERKHRLSTMLKIRGLLTPEQRAQMSQIQDEKHAKRMGEMMARIGQSCGEDLVSLCPDAEPGREAMMCLQDNKDELSDACKEGLREHRGGKGKGKGGGKGHGKKKGKDKSQAQDPDQDDQESDSEQD